MKIRNILFSIAVSASLTMGAETVILNEDFNSGDYNKSFPFVFDGDALAPNQSIAAIFWSSAAGSYQPWWVAKDAASSTDIFFVSHSWYTSPAESDDWFVSIPLNIDSEGYVLEFDAQSVIVRSDADRLSDLWLYMIQDFENLEELPEQPDMIWKEIPYGADKGNCEDDWTHFSFPLDAYAGQTVRLLFANKNADKDLLAVDNVKVARSDIAELTIEEYSPYVVTDDFTYTVRLTGVASEGLQDYAVTLSCGSASETWTGTLLKQGESELFSLTIPLEIDKPTDFKAVVESANMGKREVRGTVTRMAFEPVYRLMAEETTGVWCGNCPMATYNFECIEADPEMGPRFLPISVHISDGASTEPMEDEEYARQLGVSVAPMVIINRTVSSGFSSYLDGKFDVNAKNTFANFIYRQMQASTTLDVAVDGEWVIEGADTTAIKCKATVRPAITIAGKNYRVGFVLTENNVGIDNNRQWMQYNYLSGAPEEYGWTEWTQLPERVGNLRYHDVARSIARFDGLALSLPGSLSCGQEYEYEYVMEIPDKAQVAENGRVISNAIQTYNCEITAFVIDFDTKQIVNSARFAIGENAEHRFTIADYLGIEGVEVDADGAPARYFDVMGREISNPCAGQVLIKKQGQKNQKFIAYP